MPCSSQDIFAWTGAVLINIGFIFGITWGSFTTWYFGAALTALYSALLFGSARGLEKRQQQEPSSADDQASTSSKAAGGGRTLLISLLYGEAILAMGVTGFFIPINVIGADCFGYDSYSYSDDRWVTNTSGITSPSVLAWAVGIDNDPWDTDVAPSSFVYLPDINTTVFTGESPLYTDTAQDDAFHYSYFALYATTAGAEPELLDTNYKTASSMVAVTDSVVCFRAAYAKSVTDVLGCYDGTNVQAHILPGVANGIDEVRVFDDADEGIVWYSGYPNDGEGRIIFSLDVNSNTTTIHSTLVIDDVEDTYTDETDDYCSTSTTRLLSLCLLFASAIPVFVVSVLLWRAKSIASTGLTSLVGLIAAYCMIVTIVAPSTFPFFPFDSYPHAIGWLICGAVYCLAYLPIAVFDLSTPPLRWGAITAAVSYLLGLSHILFFLNYNFSVVSWIVFLVVGSVPLSLLGLVSDNWFMSLLGAGVAFSSSIRLCIALGDNLGGDEGLNSFFLVVFVSLAVTGLLVGGVGYLLGKNKQAIKQALASALSPLEEPVKAIMGGSATKSATSTHEQKTVPVATNIEEEELEDVEF